MRKPVKVVHQAHQIPCDCCGSWLDHWKKSEGDQSPFCADAQCLRSAITAVAVRRTDRDDDKLYIIPVCHLHHHNGLEFDTRTFMVPAESRPSCSHAAGGDQRVIPYPDFATSPALS